MLYLLDWYSFGFVSVLECGCQSSHVHSSLASLPRFLKEMICRGVVVWFYLALTIWSVTSVNACPVTFTNLKHCFIAFAIPSEKQWSSLRMYSLKVLPLHRPIFCICISEKPSGRGRMLLQCVKSVCRFIWLVSLDTMGIVILLLLVWAPCWCCQPCHCMPCYPSNRRIWTFFQLLYFHVSVGSAVPAHRLDSGLGCQWSVGTCRLLCVRSIGCLTLALPHLLWGCLWGGRFLIST